MIILGFRQPPYLTRALFHDDPNEQSRSLVGAFWVMLLCAIVGWAYVRTAAVAEDAFITFRVIDNALNGYGLVWNAANGCRFIRIRRGRYCCLPLARLAGIFGIWRWCFR